MLITIFHPMPVSRLQSDVTSIIQLILLLQNPIAIVLARSLSMTCLSISFLRFDAHPYTEPAVANDGNLQNKIPSKSTFHEGHFSGTKYEL